MIDTGHRRCQGTSPTWPFGQTLVLVFEKPIGLFGIMQDVASSFFSPKELVASSLPTVQVKSVKLHGRTHDLVLFFFSFDSYSESESV
jgi:hypothetical protein